MSGSDPREDAPRTGLARWLNATTLGVVLLILSVGASLARVLTIQEEIFDPSKNIIRIAHWQLELGYRDAVQAVIDEYEKTHKGVMVVQMPVTEKVYGAWLNTHLVAGTAPDLSEMGFSKVLQNTQYLARFYIPMTELIDKPNPYNKGTPLENLPWRETFLDGMRGSYVPELQDYFSAPTTFYTVRMFYNKNLMAKATGKSEPPKTLGELLDACKKIRELGARTGQDLEPIASSSYNAGIVLDRYQIPFTASYEPALDDNIDGDVTQQEVYAGLCGHKVSFDDPRVKALYACQRRIADEFPTGFMSGGRDDAALRFVQGQAVMIATGSWDAASLFQQSDFEVGIMEAPLPGPGEQWYDLISGRGSEAGTAGGGLYGVYKFGRRPEQAIDFLRFITSQKYNQLLNQKAEWLPVVVGSRPSDRMLPFIPDPKGFNTRVDFHFGGTISTIYDGAYWRYVQGTIGYEEFSKTIMDAMTDPAGGGDKAWAKDYDDRWRWCRNQDRVLAMQGIRALMDPKATDAPAKYRTILLQQTRANNGQDFADFFKRVRGRPIPEE